MRFVTIIILTSVSAPNVKAEKLANFDVEIEKSRSSIENVRIRLEATDSLFDTSRAATKMQEKKSALNLARHWKSANDCRAAIREYQGFINLSQTISDEQAKEAYLSLARCYKSSGDANRAFKFYRLYVSSYLTSTTRSEETLVTALKDLIDITMQNSLLSSKQVSKLISSLSIIVSNEEYTAKIKLWSARLAERFGYESLATKWYEAIYKNGQLEDKSTKMLAYYYNSLVKFTQGSKEKSRKLLKEAINMAANTRDATIYLTIARMYVHDQKYKNALKYYQRISQDESDYREALYEQAFVAMRLNNVALALSCVDTFQQKFKNTPESITLNSIAAYLHLQSGNLKLTAQKIEEIDKLYSNLDRWLSMNFNYLDAVPHNKVSKLLEKTEGIIEPVKSIKMADANYIRIDQNEAALNESRNSLRRLIFILGRSNLNEIRPGWVKKTDEIKNLATELLGAGHRLIASELNFLKDKIEAHDYQHIVVNMKKRMEMYSTNSLNRFNKGQWVRWYNFEKLAESLMRKHDDLMQAKAKLAYIRRLNYKDKNLSLDQEINRLASRLKAMKSFSLRGRELARNAQIEIKLDLAELPAFKKFYLGYVNSIYDEVKTLESYRKSINLFAEGELKRKFGLAWQEWELVAQKMYKVINKFERDANLALTKQMRLLDELTNRHENLRSILEAHRFDVEKILARNARNIVQQYKLDINEHRAKLKKWSGDLRWLGFETVKSSEDKLHKKYLLEKEMLNGSL